MLLTMMNTVYPTFGFSGFGYRSVTEAEMAKNEHVSLKVPYVKGYVIIAADGSAYYYDHEGASWKEFTKPFKGLRKHCIDSKL